MTSLPRRQPTVPPTIQRFHGPRTLAFVALLLAAALAAHGPVAQWVSYHAFADARGWPGLPNAENVLSNLPFAVIGAWACGALLCAFLTERIDARWAGMPALSAAMAPAWRGGGSR